MGKLMVLAVAILVFPLHALAAAPESSESCAPPRPKNGTAGILTAVDLYEINDYPGQPTLVVVTTPCDFNRLIVAAGPRQELVLFGLSGTSWTMLVRVFAKSAQAVGRVVQTGQRVYVVPSGGG